jgi:hypothetical protein
LLIDEMKRLATTTNTYDLVIEGESYRQRLKPKLSKSTPAGQNKRSSTH